jgi:hypothetical protein
MKATINKDAYGMYVVQSGTSIERFSSHSEAFHYALDKYGKVTVRYFKNDEI